jgi:hypothetical protein
MLEYVYEIEILEMLLEVSLYCSSFHCQFWRCHGFLEIEILRFYYIKRNTI